MALLRLRLISFEVSVTFLLFMIQLWYVAWLWIIQGLLVLLFRGGEMTSWE